jgi:hypothetical protein
VKRPLKRKGALPAPIPLIQSPQSKTKTAFSQGVCKHEATRTARLPDNHMHYAQLVCALCGRHLRWLPRPENVERRRLTAFKLARLLMCEGLSDWQRRFVVGVSKQPRLSPKQEVLVLRLCLQYLEDAP